MTVRNLSIGLLVAGTALFASYLPAPDAGRLARAAELYAADAEAGARALAFETGQQWQQLSARAGSTIAGLELPRVSTPALDAQTLEAAGVGLALLGILGLLVVAYRRAPGQLPSWLTRWVSAPSRRTRPGSRRAGRAGRRVERARTMARRGGVTLDVARRTTLSRDAVELMARVHGPEKISGRGTSFRPGGLRRAHA